MAGVLPAGGYADPGGTSEIVSENDIIALRLMGMQGDPAPGDTPQYARITTHRLALSQHACGHRGFTAIVTVFRNVAASPGETWRLSMSRISGW